MENYNIIREAERLESLFDYQGAIRKLSELPSSDSQFLATQFKISRLNKRLKQNLLESSDWVVVWQNGINGKGGYHGPGSIVRNLVSSVPSREFIDDSDDTLPHQHTYRYTAPKMIVIDHVINSIDSINYYLNAARNGCRIILMHLADENYADLYCIYEACELVYRNYWNETLSSRRNIRHFPLGDFSSLEYLDIPANRNINDRKYLWNFVGDPNKQDRIDAIKAFETLPQGYVFTVNGFFDPKKLPARDYRVILANSVFTLAPRGWTNIDTFRFWEALEFGSIPIIVGNDAQRYFQNFFSPEKLSLPVFESWENARRWVESTRNLKDYLQCLAYTIRSQWAGAKDRLKAQFVDDFRRLNQL